MLLAVFNWDLDTWWDEHGWNVVWIVVIAAVAIFLLRRTVHRIVRPAVEREMAGRPQVEIDRRADTLANVLNGTGKFVIVIIALLTLLPELGIDMTALLAGVSITSLAISFGAQSLVRDALSGLFILSENQYVVGETVTVAGVTGVVEEVTLRRTVVRDADGVLHSVPNGTIATASNHTRDFARVRVSIPLANASDLERVRGIADRVGTELANDPAYSSMILEAPRFRRIESVDTLGGIAAYVNGTVVPGRQWEVTGALRARLLEALKAEDIKTPWN